MIKGLKKAFTVLEMLIVLAVVAVLAAILIPVFSKITENAKEKVSFVNCTNAVLCGKIIDAENDSETTVYSGIVSSEGGGKDDYYYVFLDGELYKLSGVVGYDGLQDGIKQSAKYSVIFESADGTSEGVIETEEVVGEEAAFMLGTAEVEGAVYTSVFYCNVTDGNYYSTAYIYGGVLFESEGNVTITLYEEQSPQPEPEEPVVPDHQHIYGLGWEFNEEFHWHPCLIEGCTFIDEDVTFPHEFDDGVCFWCGYVEGT